MRPKLLESILLAYFYGNAPTRISVSQRCNTSVASVGKVAKALVESKIMCEKTFSLNGSPPCPHLFIDDDANTMLINLSSPTFHLTIFDPNAYVRFQATHNYDTSVTFDDNMNIFLSRCGLKAKQSGHPFSAIAVIYRDDYKQSYLENLDAQAILPHIANKDKISKLIYSVFHKFPTAQLTVSQAISEAMRFGITSGICGNEGVSYIFLGSRVSSFHIHKNNSVTVCAPQNILSEHERQLLIKKRSITKDELDSIFVKLSIFMDSAFSPSVILLESDYQLPDDETAKRIDRAFAQNGITPPIIRFKSSEEPLCVLGAIRSSMFSIAQKHILS